MCTVRPLRAASRRAWFDLCHSYVGLLTGMRPHAFSVSVDERSLNYSSVIDGPIDNIISALEVSCHHYHRCTVNRSHAPSRSVAAGHAQGGKPIGLFLRSALQNITSYEAAIPVLNQTRLIAPVYIIVAGTENGACIHSRLPPWAAWGRCWRSRPPLRAHVRLPHLSCRRPCVQAKALSSPAIETTRMTRTVQPTVCGRWPLRPPGGAWKQTTTT